jgi:hypothetical protein
MRRMTTALAGAMLIVSAAAAPALAQERIVPPPSAEALVAATNAMLRPADLSGALLVGLPRSDRRFTTGFFNPPGGQDPMPVCVSGPSYQTVSIPRDDAIGYLASYGRIQQYEYQYPSAAAASNVWKQLSAQVASGCRTTFTENGVTTANASARIPGVPGGQRGWAVSNSGNLNAFSAVHLIGDTIQLVSYDSGERAVPSKARAAMGALATRLAGRWAERTQLSVTQDETLTQAERTMVQPSDVPATLPMATAADGGWSSFQSSVPATGPNVYCRSQAKLPQGSATFTSVLFSGGDVLGITGKGNVMQQVEVYASADAARAVWQSVTAAVAKCSKNPTGAIPTKKVFNRSSNGTSSVAMGDVPGVWTSTLDTFPGIDKGFTNAAYSVYLLAGDSIQQVMYGITEKGITDVTVDRAAVDAMAKSLADRWVSFTG